MSKFNTAGVVVALVIAIAAFFTGGGEATTPDVGGSTADNWLVGQEIVGNDDGGDNDSWIEGSTDTQLFFVDAGNDRIGISTSTPGTLLDLHSSATTTITVDSDASSQGGCIKVKDLDGSGFSYGTVNDGAVTWSTTSCE